MQRGDLFRLVKEKYETPDSIVDLSRSLLSASNPYVATDDALHEIWSAFPQSCADHVFVLATLRSKQIRPIVLSALEVGFSPDDLKDLLWGLVVLIVRYQLVGKRRTGVLESACAKVASEIYNKEIQTASHFGKSIRAVLPTDEEFQADVLTYAEANGKRVFYILAALEANFGSGDIGYDSGEGQIFI